MSELVLFHASLSPCAHKVRLVFLERRISFKSQLLDLTRKENLEPDYLKINPRGLVPAIVHEGKVITESTVICEYLEEVYSELPLMPQSAFKKAQVRYIQKLVDEVLHPNTMPIIFGALIRYVWLSKSEQGRIELLAKVPDPNRRVRQARLIAHGLDAEDVKPAIEAWCRVFSTLESKLGETEWLAGDDYTLADCAVAPYAYAMTYLKADAFFLRFPRIKDWLGRVMARPSFDESVSPYVLKEQRERMSILADKSKDQLNHLFQASTQ